MLTTEQELFNNTVAAGLAVATLKLMRSGHQVVERPEGSDKLDATVLVNALVTASLAATEDNNGTAAEVMTAIANFVTEINRIEQASKAAAEGKIV